jgi:homopolymeric O-antigen transport system ATP-binding protein
MANDVVIRAEGLGKKYLIGHAIEREPYTALRDVVARGARNAWHKAGDLARGHALVPGGTVEEFWALKDVSFDVRRGEVLGIIGRNGAGKSTLLKILSRITEPSAGRVTIRGRVASLLEVGTGFHPELSGRENIYLNGAILGMSRAEIRRKFDEIVAFAEVEKFLDTPVKRYSSGMYVRLAFAIAAHLEPEILVVDEVLAVGDAEFQKKCLGKMDEVSRREGRTVLFVSHNLDAIARICRRGLLLSGGNAVFSGSAADVVERYARARLGPSRSLEDFRAPRSPGENELIAVWTATPQGRLCSTFSQGESIQVGIAVRLKSGTTRDFALVIENQDTRPLFTTHLTDCSAPYRGSGDATFFVDIKQPVLRNGEYHVSLASFIPGSQRVCDSVFHFPLFSIVGAGAAFPADRRWGDLYFPIEWRLAFQQRREDSAQATALLRPARAR